MGALLELSREQILAHRRAAGVLDARLPWGRGALAQAAIAGLQDSMPRAALLSLHARVEDVRADALDDPALIQVWGPRYSCYVIGAEDHAIFTLGRLPNDVRGRERAFRIAAGLERLLGAGITDDRRIGAELGVHPNAIKYATTTGTVRIRWDGARSPEIWCVPAPEVDPTVAQRELARRHLRIFGPATAASFADWAGVSARAATATYASLAAEAELLGVKTPLGEAAILATDEADFRSPAGPPAPARLLPSGDAYFLLHGRERELLLPDPVHRGELWTSRVWPGALLLDGEVRGTWRRAGQLLRIHAWGRLGASERDTVEAEAAGLPLPGMAGQIRVAWD